MCGVLTYYHAPLTQSCNAKMEKHLTPLSVNHTVVVRFFSFYILNTKYIHIKSLCVYLLSHDDDCQ